MLIFQGLPALSKFRNQKLLTSIQDIESSVTALYAEYVHFVEVNKALTAEESLIITSLLKYGPRTAAIQPKGNLLLVTPRPGTISPWSTKATNIAHNAGLSSVGRIERGIAYYLKGNTNITVNKLLHSLICDRMTEATFLAMSEVESLFVAHDPAQTMTIPMLTEGKAAMQKANVDLGLALADNEIDYLVSSFSHLQRDPTDVELMMFAQANSEHCRHKIFNASWTIDNKDEDSSLFEMIKNTYKKNDENVLSAYDDNAAVIVGTDAGRFFPNPTTKTYESYFEPVNILIKVETHNHPTAISPFSGAGTGSGGEIRDEGAVGRGSKPKAGLTGFTVSNLNIPEFPQPWETPYGKPDRIVSALDVMIDGPLGGAAFNNEFGRPNLCGYFRVFEMDHEGERRGYHKPIMIAGGYGNIRTEHVEQFEFDAGCKLIVIGGSAMLIGLGGGAASSMSSGVSAEDLDFASVQRQNPEMERRCQEVIDQCWQLGNLNPIAFIHDVGAGGLSNAFPELVKDGGCGGKFELRNIPNDESSMSPLAIWCNEAQERYVMAISPENIAVFEAICQRERCPYAIVGESTKNKQIVLSDKYFGDNPIDLPMSVLFGSPPKIHKNIQSMRSALTSFDFSGVLINEAIDRVLKHPTVASKSFLITIGDRSVTGTVARDQMIGPWQVPVADCAVTTSGYDSYSGEAMAMGERSPLALLNAPASGRMAIGEAITNIAACNIKQISDIKLSANWMSSSGQPGEDEKLYRTVEAVGMNFCPELGITIPVGKDSMSMRTSWKERGEDKAVTSPLSLIITAFSPVQDVRKTLTPQLRNDLGDTTLLYIDLGENKNRMGGSILAQTYNTLSNNSPDVDDTKILKAFFGAIQELSSDGSIIAYHDRSDGGLFTTLVEMSFAGHVGIDISLDEQKADSLNILFNEELGAVIQIATKSAEYVKKYFSKINIPTTTIAKLNSSEAITISRDSVLLYSKNFLELLRDWSETSFQIQAKRDNSECAKQEFDGLLIHDPGISVDLAFDINENITKPYINSAARPRIAILREQGINGQVEMAAAFDRAEFDSIDVHMSDLLSGRVKLNSFKGLVACGGFSYGDVLGAGEGWAKTILFNEKLKEEFQAFFNRNDSFSLGVCNGCQMLSNLKELIPGAECWPKFVRNTSEQFEARFSLVRIEPSPSVLLSGMAGSVMPVAVAHGEGRVEFKNNSEAKKYNSSGGVTLRFIDNLKQTTERYPSNPNGSLMGITGVTSTDGRANIMMPHPERVFRAVTNSWHPSEWKEDGPWLRLFRNARTFVD
ncbi:MAG: phosphoribosylformylglycinamidine synthase [Porticoccus sp.]|nr:phosphoribosylformylglycinamidine synthase [Porticoccus sp.]